MVVPRDACDRSTVDETVQCCRKTIDSHTSEDWMLEEAMSVNETIFGMNRRSMLGRSNVLCNRIQRIATACPGVTEDLEELFWLVTVLSLDSIDRETERKREEFLR